MDKIYKKAIEKIKIDGETFADDAMKGVYLEQSKALDELHKIIGKIYIDHSKDGFLNLTSVEKVAIIAKTTKTLKDMGLKLGNSEVDKVSDILSNVFKTTYYKNLYTLESGMTINIKLPILKKEFVNAAVNMEYKGEFFSDRIWLNKSKMIDKLQSSITGAMKGDVTIDKVGRNIRDTFNVTAYESKRLVQNETAKVQSQASIDIANSVGVEKHMWSATLDGRTEPECAENDGKIYNIDDNSSPEIPLHVSCRCCWINIPYENWNPTNRRDNETKEIISYKNYSEWSKAKGVD